MGLSRLMPGFVMKLRDVCEPARGAELVSTRKWPNIVVHSDLLQSDLLVKVIESVDYSPQRSQSLTNGRTRGVKARLLGCLPRSSSLRPESRVHILLLSSYNIPNGGRDVS